MAVLSIRPQTASAASSSQHSIGSIVSESLELAVRYGDVPAPRESGRRSPPVPSHHCSQPPCALYAPVVAVLTLAYTEVSPWTAPLFIAPALAAQKLFAMYLQQRTLASDLKGANETPQPIEP